MSEKIESTVEKPCLKQDAAMTRVKEQVQRLRSRLDNKGIDSVLTTVLYVFNCDQHGQPAHHFDLVTSSLSDLAPAALPHAITATETLLAALKARVS